MIHTNKLRTSLRYGKFALAGVGIFAVMLLLSIAFSGKGDKKADLVPSQGIVGPEFPNKLPDQRAVPSSQSSPLAVSNPIMPDVRLQLDASYKKLEGGAGEQSSYRNYAKSSDIGEQTISIRVSKLEDQEALDSYLVKFFERFKDQRSDEQRTTLNGNKAFVFNSLSAGGRLMTRHTVIESMQYIHYITVTSNVSANSELVKQELTKTMDEVLKNYSVPAFNPYDESYKFPRREGTP